MRKPHEPAGNAREIVNFMLIPACSHHVSHIELTQKYTQTVLQSIEDTTYKSCIHV